MQGQRIYPRIPSAASRFSQNLGPEADDRSLLATSSSDISVSLGFVANFYFFALPSAAVNCEVRRLAPHRRNHLSGWEQDTSRARWNLGLRF